MATVFKSLSKPNGKVEEKDGAGADTTKNRQRVLILSSRGVTMRYGNPQLPLLPKRDRTATDMSNSVTDIFSMTSTPSSLTAAKMQSSTQSQNSTSSTNSPIYTTATMSSSSRRERAKICTSG